MIVKCKECKGSGKVSVPDEEVVTVEGISFKIFHTSHGTWNNAPCVCFGSRGRVHSSEYCPWMAQRKKLTAALGPARPADLEEDPRS